VDARAPLFAAGYLLLAELAHWSGEAHRQVRDERAVLTHRIAVLALLVLAAVALGALILFAAGLPLAGPLARLALGVTAATITLALIATLTRHPTHRN
jgi:membrane protein YdbS with pleckstrin-like domain